MGNDQPGDWKRQLVAESIVREAIAQIEDEADRLTYDYRHPNWREELAAAVASLPDISEEP